MKAINSAGATTASAATKAIPPSKIEILASVNQNPPQLDLLFQKDEISKCLLHHCGDDPMQSFPFYNPPLSPVQRFSKQQSAKLIRQFVHDRMIQLLLLEFHLQKEQVSAFLKQQAPLILDFLTCTPQIPLDTWSTYEKQAINAILIHFRDKGSPLPHALRHIDQYLPSFDPSICMICCQGRYVLHDMEGFLVCNNAKCRHQASNLVEARITYGTGYSNELSWTQNKTVTLHEPLPAVSLLLSTSSLNSTSPNVNASSNAAAATTALLPSAPVGIFAPYASLPGSSGYPNSSHERWLHFCETVEPFRGILAKHVDRNIVEAAEHHLQKHFGITLVRDLTFNNVRDAVKNVWPNHFPAPTNNHFFFVMHVFGFRIPYLAEEDFELASFLFQRTEQLWPYFAGPNSNACFSHSYIIAQIMHLLQRPDIAAFFPFAKEGIRNEQFSKIFDEITKTLLQESTFYSNLPLFDIPSL